MAKYMISYDLNYPGQKYDKLIYAIQSVGAWCHCLGSTWIVVSNLSHAQIRDNLLIHIDGNDKLIVAELTGAAAWQGFDENDSSWLKNNL